MDKFGLPEKTYELIKNYLSTVKEIDNIKIFGSRARGNYKPNSDIDLVLFGKDLNEKIILHIATELDELPTPYKFDILDYKTIDNENLKNIIDNFSIDF